MHLLKCFFSMKSWVVVFITSIMFLFSYYVYALGSSRETGRDWTRWRAGTPGISCPVKSLFVCQVSLSPCVIKR